MAYRFIEFLTRVFEENRSAEAIIWNDRSFDYAWLLERIAHWSRRLDIFGIDPGRVVLLEADFSPNSAALLLALIERQAILVPLSVAPDLNRDKFIRVGQVESRIRLDARDEATCESTGHLASYSLYDRLRSEGHPGLVLFSSGSTGESKAAVHDFDKLLGKFRTRRRNLRTVAFLLFDHIGGIDTLLYSLSNGSCVITLSERSPEAVCAAIERHRAEVLPVSPTFLNLLILSEAYRRFNLSSLKFITYGTEVMPEATLKRCAELFPGVTILQKYGTTEVGTLRSKSESSSSTWVKIGGEGYATRVIDGKLQIKADSAMLGYLNAPSPFTEDGWFITGDLVEQNGEYLRFLGRESDIINVGGEKVFPAEVESVIKELDFVAEAEVYGEKNPIVGNIICARVRLRDNIDAKEAILNIKKHCRSRLPSFKVPVKVEAVEDWQYTVRFKKMRKTTGQQ